MKSAHRRDLHRIDSGVDADPMWVEKTLNLVEAKWSDALRSVIRNESLPTDDALADLLAFVALVCRPSPSHPMGNFIDRASKAELRAAFSNQQGREQIKGVLADQGKELDEAALTDLAEYAKGDTYEVSFDRTWDVQTMIVSGVSLHPVLGNRHWSLWAVAEDTSDLICSDSPLSLTWLSRVAGPEPPGFGQTITFVTVPLGRRLVLAYSFEPLEERRTIDVDVVADVNSRTAMLADQLFFARPDFVWRMGDDRLGNAGSTEA